MDNRPDQLRMQDEGVREKLSQERGEIDPNPSAAGEELEEIRLELARTRSQMSETVYALQGRMNPQYVREQATSQAKDTAKEAGSSVVDTIKNNPVPTALTGAGIVGLGWLVVNVSKGDSGSSGQQSSGQQSGTEGPRYYDSSGHSYTTSYEGREFGDRAREAGGQAQEKAGQAGRQAQEQAQRAKGGFQRILQESPLALVLRSSKTVHKSAPPIPRRSGRPAPHPRSGLPV